MRNLFADDDVVAVANVDADEEDDICDAEALSEADDSLDDDGEAGLEPCSAGEDLDLAGIDPHRPTQARPGSPAKMAVMRARLLAGLPLCDPRDAAVAADLKSKARRRGEGRLEAALLQAWRQPRERHLSIEDGRSRQYLCERG